MEEERLMILKMLEEGKINSQEAAALLEALDEHQEKVIISPADAKPEGQPAGASAADWNDHGRPLDPRRRDGEGWEEFADRVSSAASELGERMGERFARLGEEIERKASTSGWWVNDWFGPLQRIDQSFEGRFEEGDGPVQLDLTGTNGNMLISAWDNDGYRLELQSTVRAASESQARDRVTRAVGIKTGARMMRVDAPDQHGWGISTRVLLQIPRRLAYSGQFITSNGNIALKELNLIDCKTTTANGRIDLAHIAGDRLDVRSSNGRIEGFTSVSRLNAVTSNGRIELMFEGDPGRQYTLKTSNGRIELAIPASWACRFDATTSMGSIRMEAGGLDFHENTSSPGHSHVRASRGTPETQAEFVLRSSNGSIRTYDAR